MPPKSPYIPFAPLAQWLARNLGKIEVESSILSGGSCLLCCATSTGQNPQCGLKMTALKTPTRKSVSEWVGDWWLWLLRQLPVVQILLVESCQRLLSDYSPLVYAGIARRSLEPVIREET